MDFLAELDARLKSLPAIASSGPARRTAGGEAEGSHRFTIRKDRYSSAIPAHFPAEGLGFLLTWRKATPI